MPKPVVIVESPAKARTISGFLGDDYVVESSIGHIRDLPRNAQEIPQAYRNEPWARLGVDVESGFKPLYVVAKEKKTQVNKLRALVKEASEVYLATDEDREGESIAWHLLEVLAPKVPVKRMVFHEITPTAIQHAIENWRDLDRRLVDAQEARRILDRLYGYELSPVLWKKVMPRLSAGRVQSVATRMLVERERARMHFRSATWWSIQCRLSTGGSSTPSAVLTETPVKPPAVASDGPSSSRELDAVDSEDPPSFVATVVSVEGRKVATGKDFSDTGELKTSEGLLLLDQVLSREIVAKLERASFEVLQVTEKPYKKSPPPPFMTSTLQQEAGRKLRFSASRTMQVAQRLYELGYITYMRTDSTALADTAVEACRREILQGFGQEYLPASPRRYKSKVKNAQEAHEAIRPAGEEFRSPASVRGSLSNDEYKLYELIWQRTVASQMADAVGTTAQVRIKAELDSSDRSNPPHHGSIPYAELTASGRVVTFPGFLKAYLVSEDNTEDDQPEELSRLPRLSSGQLLELVDAQPEEHSTQPPPRYTEASLVKALEEMGVGRPSTYASIIATIQERGYVWKKGMALVPSFTAFAVVGLLEQYFPELVDYGFTASMEDDLDEIARGRREMVPWLEAFYFGEEHPPSTSQEHDGVRYKEAGDGSARRISTKAGLKTAVAEQLALIDARDINSIPIGTDKNGVDIVVRVGRYGPYLQRGDDRAPIPDNICPDELTVEVAERLLDTPSEDRVLGTDPATGELVTVKAGRFGPYVQLGEGDPSKKSKPRTASLLKSMSMESVTLEQALSLLTLPRVLGTDPVTGEEILAANGRFGPYLKRGKETRSLDSEEAILTIDLDTAIQLFAQPKSRLNARRSQEPLKELGPDPETGITILLKDGRFGPYVTDGTVNASLRRGDTVESLTAERAAELLAERRAAIALSPDRSSKSSKTTKTTKAAKSTSAKSKAAKSTSPKSTS